MGLSKEKAVLLILCVLLATSIGIAYYFWRKPVTRTYYVVTCRYRQEAKFDPIIIIRPSFLYENRTILHPGETAYLNLVKQVNISFHYRFNCSQPPTSFTLNYSVDGVLEVEGGWRKIFTLTSNKISDQMEIEENYTLKIEEIKKIIQIIEEETGIHATKYFYKIIPHIQVETSTNAGLISETYEPIMTIILSNIKSGGYINFAGLNYVREGNLGYYRNREVVWSLFGLSSTVRTMRYISLIIIACFSASLLYVVKLMVTKPPPSPIEEIKKKYGDKIVESCGTPNKQIKEITIRVKSIEDLYKVSEETIRPILHEETFSENEGRKIKQHVFYVLDDNIRYEHIIEEPVAEKGKNRGKPHKSLKYL